MQFELCLALGVLHPDHLLQALTARQYGDWMRYYNIDPWGQQRADLRAGIIAATIHNRHRGKNESAVEPSVFMPYAKREQTTDEIKSKLRGILSAVRSTKKHG